MMEQRKTITGKGMQKLKVAVCLMCSSTGRSLWPDHVEVG